MSEVKMIKKHSTGENGLAIAGFILSLIGIPLLGLIFGIIGLNKSKEIGDAGRGLSIAAIVISSIAMFLCIILIIVTIAGAIASV